MRTLTLPKEVEHWSLTTLKEKLVRIGAKIASHGRYVTLSNGRVGGAQGAVRRHYVGNRCAETETCARLIEETGGATKFEGEPCPDGGEIVEFGPKRSEFLNSARRKRPEATKEGAQMADFGYRRCQNQSYLGNIG